MPTSRALPAPLVITHASKVLPSFVLAALLLLSLAPILLTEIPAMVDYPNHLARMSILARAGTAEAHPLYEVHWALYPNLAMDLIVPPVARWIGVELATKLFYITSQLLIVAGAMTLSFVTRGRVFASGVIACLFLYAIPFAFGFVNFEFALGIALFALAAWIGLANRPLWLRLTIHAIAVSILFFAHLFALGIYGFSIGIIELWRLLRERPPLLRTAILFAGLAAPAAIAAAIMSATGGRVGGTGIVWNAGYKIFWIGTLNGWSRPVASALTLFVLLPFCLGLVRGWFRFVGAGAWLALGFTALFIAMPFRLFDTGFVDGRVLVAAILILPAFIAAKWPDKGAKQFVWGAVLSACVINIGYSGWVQWNYRPEYQRLLAAFDLMPRNARLIAADLLEANDPPFVLLDYPMHHAATLAVYRRDAFVPTLFTYPGKQPLRPVASLQHLAVPEGRPVYWPLLESYADGTEPPRSLQYARTWWRDFDYLLMLHPEGSNPRPDLLEKVAAGERFILYRVRTRSAP